MLFEQLHVHQAHADMIKKQVEVKVEESFSALRPELLLRLEFNQRLLERANQICKGEKYSPLEDQMGWMIITLIKKRIDTIEIALEGIGVQPIRHPCEEYFLSHHEIEYFFGVKMLKEEEVIALLTSIAAPYVAAIPDLEMMSFSGVKPASEIELSIDVSIPLF